ncbi:MAG: GrpB family protein [Actinomycetota bacterium]|nr:GrpB family protein [Actinomycetota bacterium]
MVIVEYTAAWPRRFEVERRRIRAAIGPVARAVEHVGSTAVPGLAAKPIVDILVTVGDPGDEQAYVPQLEAAGYVLRVREPDHRMFRTPERDVHVHVWAEGSDEARKVLAFRDRLRADERDRAEYERTKRALAGRCRDVNYYARAKGPVIADILERSGEADRDQLEGPHP